MASIIATGVPILPLKSVTPTDSGISDVAVGHRKTPCFESEGLGVLAAGLWIDL